MSTAIRVAPTLFLGLTLMVGGAYGQTGMPAAGVPEQVRPEVGGLNGAVSSGHPLATAAGYEVLRQGGNATDAAVTMAAVLAVVRPHMNGVGGDVFALFYDAETSEVTGLNATGRAAHGATPEFFAALGIDDMPGSGVHSITVPGAVSGWAAALERYGTITLAEALEPAIEIAESGFMVSHTLAADIGGAAGRLNDAGRRIYQPGGEPVEAGDLLQVSALSGTLKTLAREGPSAFYGGTIGNSLARFLESEGSALRLEDFAAHEATWTEPISTVFRGHRVHTMPPNSQGIALLEILGMAENLDLENYEPNSAELLHEISELIKLAFADRDRWVADPAFAPVPVDQLLSPTYLADRVTEIRDRPSPDEFPSGLPGEPAGDDANGGGDTVYLMAVDESGNAVSWIQSLFGTFGSRLVDEETGIVLHNRGAGFTLEEGHPNQIAGGKRPFHTLMPALVTDDTGQFAMTIGTPGGSGQPQFITQALIQMFVFGAAPQQAIEAPRIRIGSGATLQIEERVPVNVREALSARGHELDVQSGWTANFGNLQIIRRLPSGILRTGADMRREGAAMAY